MSALRRPSHRSTLSPFVLGFLYDGDMSGFRRASEKHDHLLQELAEERFAALTRISRTLDTLIDQLRMRRTALTALEGAAREEALRVYRELHAQALRYRWYMDVQREVLGLRPHEVVEQFYRVPDPL